MKKLITLFILLNLITLAGYSQVPGYFNYQAVVRNTTGEVISNTTVSFRISILQNSESGAAVYVEKHNIRTNNFGLVNLKIGSGTVVSGSFNPTNWGTNPHFIKVEMDVSGGTSYAEFGTSQLVSVPYAFLAKNVENDKVIDADADPNNELQTLSVSGNELSITKGNTVVLPLGSVSPWTTSGSNIYYNSGFVGIGTQTPYYKLGIGGEGSEISFQDGASGAASGISWRESGNTLKAMLSYYGPGSSLKLTNQTSGGDILINAKDKIDLQTDGSTKLTVRNDGYIGIGTTDPMEMLTINGGNSTPHIRFINSIVGQSITDGLCIGLGYSSASIMNYESSPLIFGTNWAERMTIAANGYVGIGTTSPSAGLHLKGSGYPASFMYIESVSGQDAGIRLYEGTTAKWHLFNNSALGGLQIYNSASSTAIFAKQSNSYVGIRTTSPAYALHVNGDAAKTTGSTAWVISSDERLKDVHGPYIKGLSEILALQPIRYNYKKDNPRQLPSDEEQVGFIAQDVQKVFPEAVNQEEDGYLDFNIHSINVATINAIKDLNEENIQLKKKVDELESRLQQLESFFQASASK